MRARWLVLSLALLLITQLGVKCNPPTKILINTPGVGAEVASCSTDIEVALVGSFVAGTLVVTLNFVPVVAVEGPPGTFTANVGPSAPLQSGANVITAQAQRTSDGVVMTTGRAFTFAPTSSAYQIVAPGPGDLVEGPLGHSRENDYMLENCFARFVIQDSPQRDLYSVGQYGGNLIDMEVVGQGGNENFLEHSTMVNVETVLNYDSIQVWNDGSDGNPAVVRACGVDDLLDFVNPSSQVEDAGAVFPPELDDNDQEISGCTDYSLDPTKSYVKVETTLSNDDPVDDLVVLNGEWLNAGGQLEALQLPNPGVGRAGSDGWTASELHDFYGYDEALGVDYGYVTVPLGGPPNNPACPRATSYVVISGVTVVIHNANVLCVLLGFDTGDTIPNGGDLVQTRYFGVGDGSGSNTVDMAIDIKGTASGTIKGCVTRDGAPLPAAKVTIGTLDAGEIDQVLSNFVTDAQGCYEGEVPVPAAAGENYGVAAARDGTPYIGLGPEPPVTQVEVFPAGDVEVVDFDLPKTGSLKVTVSDENSSALPARVTVVGCDPSPEPLRSSANIPLAGFGSTTLGLFSDVNDRLPFGIVASELTGADGEVEFEIEPGTYQVFVSRGTEYSSFDTEVTVDDSVQASVNAQIALVIDTDGFVSSDFHVHGINSADSRVTHLKRVNGYAGEGIDNLVMTDHHVHTDLSPVIAAEGLGAWLAATVGEEITTFDYGHFNAYPLTVDATRISGGSTDWAVAAPVGMDFPSAGAFNATPAEILALATAGPQSTPDTTIQINHIDSHFVPLKIDTSVSPIADGLDDAGRLGRRLDEPATGPGAVNLFAHFPALELWNGDGRGAQSNFLNERMGIWFNHLNEGLRTTAIADTDSHRFTSLNSSGARTWTAASALTDEPATLDGGEVARSVADGKAVGGQGIYVQTRLVGVNSGDVADLTESGKTTMSDPLGDVDLEISIQAPIWAEYDTIEIYANAATAPLDPGEPYLFSATPTQTLVSPAFPISTVNVFPGIPGASRFETVSHTVSFSGLPADTWFVVVVKGSDAVSEPMFPVYPDNLSSASNVLRDAGGACLPTGLGDLLDGNLGESGVTALGYTNALYYEAP